MAAETQILEQILAELRAQRHPDAMWSVADIASELGYTASHVQNSIVCQPDFPKPVRPRTRKNKGGFTQGKPRWYPDEVREWIKQWRD